MAIRHTSWPESVVDEEPINRDEHGPDIPLQEPGEWPGLPPDWDFNVSENGGDPIALAIADKLLNFDVSAPHAMSIIIAEELRARFPGLGYTPSATHPAEEEVQTTSQPHTDGGGLRFNAGKNMLELIPVEWIWGLGMVLTRGAAKYAVRNWEKGMDWSYPLACALRHTIKFVCGERYDPETGCHHMFMAAWNCCALASYDIREVGNNDLVGKRKWLELVATVPGPELQAIIDKATKK